MQLTTLDRPLGGAFILESIMRWRNDIWKPTQGQLLPFIEITDFKDDFPVIFIDFDHKAGLSEAYFAMASPRLSPANTQPVGLLVGSGQHQP